MAYDAADDAARDRFGDDAETSIRSSPRESGGCARVAKGCGCVAGVLVLLLVAAGTWVAFSWRHWAVFAVRTVAETALADAPLPEDQRRRILTAVDGLGAEFTAGRIGIEQMGSVCEELVQGPVMPLAFLAAIDARFVRGSGLPEEERAAARRTLERAARGVVDGTIEPEQAFDLLQPLLEQDRDDPDSFRLRDRLADDELRGFVATVRERVDAAGVPDEPFEVDVAAEVEAAISRVLGRRAEAEGP